MGYPTNLPVGPGSDKAVFESSKFRGLKYVQVAKELEKKGLDVIGISIDSESGAVTITVKKDEKHTAMQLDKIITEVVKAKYGNKTGLTTSVDGLGKMSAVITPEGSKNTATANVENIEIINYDM